MKSNEFVVYYRGAHISFILVSDADEHRYLIHTGIEVDKIDSVVISQFMSRMSHNWRFLSPALRNFIRKDNTYTYEILFTVENTNRYLLNYYLFALNSYMYKKYARNYLGPRIKSNTNHKVYFADFTENLAEYLVNCKTLFDQQPVFRELHITKKLGSL